MLLVAPMTPVLLKGPASYIRSVLAPRFLARSHQVVILEGLWFGDEPLRGATTGTADQQQVIDGDIGDEDVMDCLLRRYSPGAIIHLTAVSNDPCSAIEPALTKRINLDVTAAFMLAAKGHGVSKLVNASSASAYGIKEEAACRRGPGFASTIGGALKFVIVLRPQD